MSFISKTIKYVIVYPVVGIFGAAAIITVTAKTLTALVEYEVETVETVIELPQAERDEYLCREILTGWAFNDTEAQNLGALLNTSFEYKQSRIAATHHTVKGFNTATRQGNVRLCKMDYAYLVN
tara:strand:+ start:102 stop:473 length:372 start_codon:yes stop_codon:yes gene_type:complete